VQAFLAGSPLPADPLSTREREVLQLIAEGRNMKEIGDVLGISARTAETHRARIMTKLEIHDVPGSSATRSSTG
jgi:DNA-binding NarL/FixJ family response regulator